MTLDARRIALQGIGYGALVVALQGFSEVAADAPPQAATGGFGAPRVVIRPMLRNDDEELLLLVSIALNTLDLN